VDDLKDELVRHSFSTGLSVAVSSSTAPPQFISVILVPAEDTTLMQSKSGNTSVDIGSFSRIQDCYCSLRFGTFSEKKETV
jgi:hypothetical protein